MIEQYELYCLADKLFYDIFGTQQTDNGDFAECARPVPEEWDHAPSDTWMHYAPKNRPVPPQGWKIHVSACLADAERVVSTVWDYCMARELAFKFLRGRPVVMMLNSKAAFRGSSGKLVTIYPSDAEQFETVLTELNELLRGVQGPYILSDLRFDAGPLFVRYGGFVERHCLSESGERVLALEDGEGRLVPDVRGPLFAVPPWVTLPEFLAPHLAARNSVTMTGLPYHVESVMHFSNGGGVYLARDERTGERVVLKEGRPHAGLDVAGRDAVTRLAHERDILERLAGLDVVPAVRDYFVLGDHHFLVEEFVDGNPLQRQLVHRYPLTHPDCSAEQRAEYAKWALGMVEQVERASEALHERGVVFGDLHPENILVTAEGRLVLIDFEVSTLVADRARQTLAHPGYAAPEGQVGVDIDRYAVACLYLGMFAPQTTITLNLHPAKVVQLAALVSELFPLPADRTARAVQTILGQHADHELSPAPEPPMPGRASWPQIREAMRTAILASATPERSDRLFPGDIKQFQPGGGINLAHGAAGVLYALARTDAGRIAEHEDWLRKRALAPETGTGIGFYDGLHGVAYVLEALGHRQDALDTLELCGREAWASPELGLYSGLAGVGLNLLHFAALTGDSAYTGLAHRVIDVTADRLGGPEDVPRISGGDHPRAGLMYGSAGPALLFLRAYERSGDTALLDRAADALRQDLRRCTWVEDGTLQVDQDWRTLPYLDEGSVGIGLVLARYLAHRQDDEFAAALVGLQAVTRAGYFVQSGLFTGRAGMIAALGMWSKGAPVSGTTPAIPNEGPDPAMTELIRWLSWHALPYGGGLAFAGDQLLRLSMDFATGTAGILFAIGTALHDQPVALPFLEPPEL